MATEDAYLSNVIYHVIIPLALALIVLRIVRGYANSLAQMIFAYLYPRYLCLDKLLEPFKVELFAPLEMQESHDSDLREAGAIRILEIGVGHGSNFIYYPRNSRLVCYDPNPNFRSTLFERHKDFPEIHLERLVVCGGESLDDVADESVDAVVVTLVLCTVTDLNKVFSEVQRVLAPGGKFYFLEHVIAPEGTYTCRLQKLINPLWKTIFLGCNVTRDLEAEIRNCGFSKVNIKNFTIPLKTIFGYVINEAILGTAEK